MNQKMFENYTVENLKTTQVYNQKNLNRKIKHKQVD